MFFTNPESKCNELASRTSEGLNFLSFLLPCPLRQNRGKNQNFDKKSIPFILPKYSQRILKQLPKNLKKIPKKFPKNPKKIPKKFSKNSQKIPKKFKNSQYSISYIALRG